MNAWDSEHVQSLYDKQTLGFLTNFNGKTELHPTRVALAFRKLVLEEGADPHDIETLRKARDPSRHLPSRFAYETLNWGCFTMMLSELGKRKELGDLLDYADSRLNATWENGGLFYPRNDQLADEEWNMVHVEPLAGNSSMGYARLNVTNGQKKMWEKPWTRELLAHRPWVDGANYADDVDFLRGFWDEDAKAMLVTVKRWQGEARELELSVKNLPPGSWATYVDGSLRGNQVLSSRGDIAIQEMVGQTEVDIVVAQVKDSKLSNGA